MGPKCYFYIRFCSVPLHCLLDISGFAKYIFSPFLLRNVYWNIIIFSNFAELFAALYAIFALRGHNQYAAAQRPSEWWERCVNSGCDFPVMVAKWDHLPKVPLCTVEIFNPWCLGLAFLNLDVFVQRRCVRQMGRCLLFHLCSSHSSKCLRSRTTRVDCHSLLQGIFLTQGSNLSLLHCR